MVYSVSITHLIKLFSNLQVIVKNYDQRSRYEYFKYVMYFRHLRFFKIQTCKFLSVGYIFINLISSIFCPQVVDVRGEKPSDCADTFVYVADVSGFGLLVVDVLRDRSWRVTNKYMFPYPSYGTFTIDGIFLLSLLTTRIRVYIIKVYNKHPSFQ